MTEITRETILARIHAGPVSYADLAGPNRPDNALRKLVHPIVEKLLAEGLIRRAMLDRRIVLAAAQWQMTDDMALREIEGRCKPSHGCLVWTGYIDPKRGPMVALGTHGKPTSVRRVIWQIKRGPLGYQDTVRVQESCEPGCASYAHMRVGRREEPFTGRKIATLTRSRIAAAHQSRAKLNWDKVRAIRASDELPRVLAERYGVDVCTIYDVLKQRTWCEFGGMFTALVRVA